MRQPTKQSEKSDVIAAIVIVIVVILGAIHFVQTGGLPAFFGRF